MIVLEKTKNQYGEEVILHSIYYDEQKGYWKEHRVNCLSSSWLGLGNCNCVSHEPEEEWIITRSAVKAILEEMKTPPILDELEEHQLNADIKTLVDETLKVSGLDLDDLGNYAEIAYKMDINPLPAIRKYFKEAGFDDLRIEFAYWQEGLHWLTVEEGGPHLICWLDNNVEPIQAWFEWNC